MHVRTLNTREVICIRTSKPSHLGKRLPIVVQVSLTKRLHCVRIFSHFGSLNGHSLLRQTPCCMRAASYVEPEITIALFPRLRPAFHRLQYVLSATESWAGAWEQECPFSTQCESESCLSIITAKKLSVRAIFLLRGHAFHM